jgi:hypothetical protein
MTSLYFLVPTLVAILISMLIVRAGAIALMMTGMRYEKAKFQALSAFTGTGFTTREAEHVVNDLRRRKIVSWLMILGNAGIVTVIVTTTSSFSKAQGLAVGTNALVLLGGLGLLVAVARHTPWASRWEVFVQSRLERFKMFEADTPIDELLHISEGFGVLRIQLLEGSPFIGKTLSEINSGLHHSLVLGIERNREWLPLPRHTSHLMPDDYMLIYGKLEELVERFR